MGTHNSNVHKQGNRIKYIKAIYYRYEIVSSLYEFMGE
jgi:hypothetical protein